jgi:hypothetical protein
MPNVRRRWRSAGKTGREQLLLCANGRERMVKFRGGQLLGVTAIVLASSALPAQERLPAFWTLGIGSRSCATWQSNSSYQRDGTNWIYGYWTGLNNAQTNPKDRMIGSKTDPQGIISEVKKNCDNQPSMALFDATSLTYREFSNR